MMHLSSICILALAPIFAQAQETVLGVYIFSRHGDRTPKYTPPANLTDLGYQEIYTSGQNFRSRYIASDASHKIVGMNTDIVKQSQISVSAPLDTVLQNSAQGFLQGLYPPVGPALSTSTLRNGTSIQAPMNGYQLIPITTISNGAGSEDAAWLQGQTNCAKAQISSTEYYRSADYLSLLNSTQSFYDSISPLVNSTFTPAQISYKNAFTIYDVLNVASIHNSTTTTNPRLSLLTPETLTQLRQLAHSHEFALAYNSTSPIRAITGSITAAEVLTALNNTISTSLSPSTAPQPPSSPKLTIQFGAYAGMLSFFGLANLTAASADFFGIPDYASTLVWELVTNTTSTTTTTASLSREDISVRFLFHNGSSSSSSSAAEPRAYPLFGQERTLLPWSEFVDGMRAFAVEGQRDWCDACGNRTGVCAPLNAGSGGDGAGSAAGSSGGRGGGGGGEGMSRAVAGVIGAVVALAVVLLVEGLVTVVAGLRVVRRKKRRGGVVEEGKKVVEESQVYTPSFGKA